MKKDYEKLHLVKQCNNVNLVEHIFYYLLLGNSTKEEVEHQ